MFWWYYNFCDACKAEHVHSNNFVRHQNVSRTKYFKNQPWICPISDFDKAENGSKFRADLHVHEISRLVRCFVVKPRATHAALWPLWGGPISTLHRDFCIPDPPEKSTLMIIYFSHVYQFNRKFVWKFFDVEVEELRCQGPMYHCTPMAN